MSEPSGKIGILGSVLSGPLQRNEEDGEETVDFYLSMCFDVLLEVLRVGDRRPLIKLERVGRRFHWIIEKWFLDAPFLRLNLKLRPTTMGEELERGLKAFIGANDEEIALSKLIVVPHFLRFDQVTLAYRVGSQSIAQECELFHGYLSSIKSTLNDSSVINFVFKINQEDQVTLAYRQFIGYSALLKHIRNIVSICDTSRGYAFDFYFRTDSSAFGILVASILEMPAIVRSSTVHVTVYDSDLTILPVETISNWLNRERHAMNQNQRERCLKFMCCGPDMMVFTNIQAVYDLLKQKFVNDKFPAIPFAFKIIGFSFAQLEEDKTIVNKATNEQFSKVSFSMPVSISNAQTNFGFVDVKRTRALKKKEETSKTAKA